MARNPRTTGAVAVLLAAVAAQLLSARQVLGGDDIPRLAVLGVVAVYVPCAVAIRRGLHAPDTTPIRPLGEVLLALRYDGVAYLCKRSRRLHRRGGRQ